MFGLTQVTALSLLALRVLAQESSSIAADATSAVASAMPSSSAAPAATSSGAVEDGSDGNDVPPSAGGNPGWNTTYFMAPSNSKLHGFWVNGLENKAYWKPVNITSRLVLTNSNKDLWAGEQELANNIAGGVGEWSGSLKEAVPEGHNYLLSLYDGTSGSKLGQTSGFTMRMNGTLPPNPPPEVAAGQGNAGASSSQGADAAQTSGGNAEPTSSGAAAGESSAAAPSASAGATSGAGRIGVSGAVALVAVGAYVLA